MSLFYIRLRNRPVTICQMVINQSIFEISSSCGLSCSLLLYYLKIRHTAPKKLQLGYTILWHQVNKLNNMTYIYCINPNIAAFLCALRSPIGYTIALKGHLVILVAIPLP